MLPRFALQELVESRLLTGVPGALLLPVPGEAAGDLRGEQPGRAGLLGISGGPDRDASTEFFCRALTIQGVLAFLLTAWVAPGLVSPDLVNGALPLYLSRPFSRAEYVLGKAAVLVALLSLITWVPVLLLFALQAGLADGGWLAPTCASPGPSSLGSLIWIAVLSLLALALSAWVRWRIVATGACSASSSWASAFGEVWSEVLRTSWGRAGEPRLPDQHRLERPVRRACAAAGAEMLDDRRSRDMPAWAAWAGPARGVRRLPVAADRRLRAREVVS